MSSSIPPRSKLLAKLSIVASMRLSCSSVTSGCFFLMASWASCLDCSKEAVMTFCIMSRRCKVVNSFSTSSFDAGSLPEAACCVRPTQTAIRTTRIVPNTRFIYPPCQLCLAFVVQRLQAQESSPTAQLRFDPQQLVVLRDTVGAGGGAGLDLACTRCHGTVGDEGVFGFTGTVRDDG